MHGTAIDVLVEVGRRHLGDPQTVGCGETVRLREEDQLVRIEGHGHIGRQLVRGQIEYLPGGGIAQG